MRNLKEEDPELLRLLMESMERAEARLNKAVNEALFSDPGGGNYVYVPPTRWQRIRRAIKNAYWSLKYRIIGTYNLCVKGECKFCENDDY